MIEITRPSLAPLAAPAHHTLGIHLESWVFSRRIAAEKPSAARLRQLDHGHTPRALRHMLSVLRAYDQRVTFFVVTALERVYPGLIEEILAAGHEIGWHGHTHARLGDEDTLSAELEAARPLLDAYHIVSFHAPEMYFFRGGYALLRQGGLRYASSMYGDARKAYTFDGVREIPISTMRDGHGPAQRDVSFPGGMGLASVARYGIPYGSGLFWGLLGERYYRDALRRLDRCGEGANLFVHDWQVVTPDAPEYRKDVGVLNNPLFLPYRIGVRDMFASLAVHYRFGRFDAYAQARAHAADRRAVVGDRNYGVHLERRRHNIAIAGEQTREHERRVDRVAV